ncbi:MAG: tetraacyldisaccharide 4-kinase [Pseudobdellovibrio sp.]|nr:tetraacyldisaccharide 4-kinase [Pseudobdellovibrio sp.]
MKWLLKVSEQIYHFLSGSKNLLYDLNVLKPVALPVPVVSVGNLSFGGVGKTPCIILLAQHLSQGKKVVVVTKSYKTSLKEPRKVDLSVINAAEIFGDEACLIQTRAPQVEVWSGPDKTATATAAMASKPDIILVDDGFSHRKLRRNFDLVLLDATVGFETYMREAENNLKRASSVLITKTNLASPAQIERITKHVAAIAPKLRSEIYISTVHTTLKSDKADPLFVFCGLGRPESFLQDLKRQGYKVIFKELFPDHYNYSAKDQSRIFAKYLDLKNENRNLKLITTQKDFVKLKNSDLLKNCQVAGHEMLMDSEAEEVLIDKIRDSL